MNDFGYSPLTYSLYSHPFFTNSVDLLVTCFSPSHSMPRIPVPPWKLAIFLVNQHYIFCGLSNNLLLPRSSNTLPHTIACFAWPGGVREGRAAFATSSDSPRILQLRDAPPQGVVDCQTLGGLPGGSRPTYRTCHWHFPSGSLHHKKIPPVNQLYRRDLLSYILLV